MKKIGSILLILAFAVSSVAMAELICLSSANPIPPEGIPSIKHAFIRSNGDVEPSTLPIQRNGNSYVLTNNIANYTLEVQKSNVLIDGAGFTIQGAYHYRYDGLTLSYVSDVTVKNLKLNIFNNGIVLNNTSNIKITNNRVDAEFCVILSNVNASEVSGNSLFGKGYCVYGQCMNCIINYNYFDGEGIKLILSNGNNITNNLFQQHITEAIELGDYNKPCYRNIICGNTLLINNPSDVPSGIGIFDGSAYNSVFRNNIVGCYSSFVVSSIIISNVHDNVFYENTFANSQYGVYVDGRGASMDDVGKEMLSMNNTFYSNNFLNISKPVQINNNASVNNWNNGSMGNYWSDYLAKYPQAKALGNSAIGDISYSLNANNTDNYPLIYPVNIVFSASLPSPISPPAAIALDDLLSNPTTTLSPIPTETNAINPAPSPTSSSHNYPTPTPTSNPHNGIAFDVLSNKILLVAIFSTIAAVSLFTAVAVYKRKK
jgi:nitrous oxidase accessory protein NosD